MESCVCCVFPWQRPVCLLTGSTGKEGDRLTWYKTTYKTTDQRVLFIVIYSHKCETDGESDAKGKNEKPNRRRWGRGERKRKREKKRNGLCLLSDPWETQRKTGWTLIGPAHKGGGERDRNERKWGEGLMEDCTARAAERHHRCLSSF